MSPKQQALAVAKQHQENERRISDLYRANRTLLSGRGAKAMLRIAPFKAGDAVVRRDEFNRLHYARIVEMNADVHNGKLIARVTLIPTTKSGAQRGNARWSVIRLIEPSNNEWKLVETSK